MAERRMFTKKITNSDAFLEMSSAAQALYFHLNQEADDDGFNNQIQAAMFRAHASIDDLKVLLMKNFIIRFESGVIVIKHWRMHNTLRKDRYSPTNFQDELSLLDIKDNGSYTLVDDIGCQVVANPVPQVRLGKDSIDKVNKYSVCFEDAWNEYPRKKEKAKAYKCYQSRLKEGYSEEEILQAIKNYSSECNAKKTEEQYIKLCATFLGPNTPFIDYTEKNYKQHAVQQPQSKQNNFNSHDQRQYTAQDYADLERKLLNKGS